MIAKYDIPAFIEHILKESKVQNISYIAHSQATQQMFYNLGGPNASYFEERVNVLIAFCPFYVLK